LRHRSSITRRTTVGAVRPGCRTGRLDRSVIDSPAAYRPAQRFTVGHDTWNRAATSLIGYPSSTTS